MFTKQQSAAWVFHEIPPEQLRAILKREEEKKVPRKDGGIFCFENEDILLPYPFVIEELPTPPDRLSCASSTEELTVHHTAVRLHNMA